MPGTITVACKLPHGLVLRLHKKIEVQDLADAMEGQATGYCAFNEKLRAHPIIRAMSSWKKKMTAGTWGAIIRQPMGISQMLGV